MKIARTILAIGLLSTLPSNVLRSQTSPLSNDPVFQAARKAQQEGRIADAEKILNGRIQAIEGTRPNSPELVPYLNMLAGIYDVSRAEPDRQATFERVLAIFERVLEIDRAAYGPSDYRSLRDLMNVASFLGPGKQDQSEQLMEQALDLARQNTKTPPGTTAEILSHLAELYENDQRWYDAEALAAEGMKICNSVSLLPGPCDHLQTTLTAIYEHEGRAVEGEQVADSAPHGMDADLPPELVALHKSAQRSEKDGLYPDAEFKYRQAVAYIEAHPKWDGGRMPVLLTGFLSDEYNSLGHVFELEGRNDLAEEAYKKAIAQREAMAAEIHAPLRSINFTALTILYQKEGRVSEVEPFFQHALELQVKGLGESSINVAKTLVMFGGLYKGEGKYAEAEPLYKRALEIYEMNLGPDNGQEVFALQSYADLLHKMNEDAKASELRDRIKKIVKP